MYLNKKEKLILRVLKDLGYHTIGRNEKFYPESDQVYRKHIVVDGIETPVFDHIFDQIKPYEKYLIIDLLEGEKNA